MLNFHEKRYCFFPIFSNCLYGIWVALRQILTHDISWYEMSYYYSDIVKKILNRCTKGLGDIINKVRSISDKFYIFQWCCSLNFFNIFLKEIFTITWCACKKHMVKMNSIIWEKRGIIGFEVFPPLSFPYLK